MKKFLFAVVVAALPAAGCIQTLPDGSIAAAPGTAALLSPQGGAFASDAPPPAHQVRDGSGRMISADPDPHVRSAIARAPCEAIGGDHAACPSN
jgi:hypothetical protein